MLAKKKPRIPNQDPRLEITVRNETVFLKRTMTIPAILQFLTREHNAAVNTGILTLVLPGSAFPLGGAVALAAGVPVGYGANDHSGATVADFHRIPCKTFTG